MNESTSMTVNLHDVRLAQLVGHGKVSNLSDQTSSSSNLSSELLTDQTDKNGNKTESLIRTTTTANLADESETPVNMMKQRVKPIPASYKRRRPHLKSPTTSSNLQPCNKRPTSTVNSKRTTKSSPIFIPPKKTTSQSAPFSSLSPDDSSSGTRTAILERQAALQDESCPSSMNNTSRSMPVKFCIQSSGSSMEEYSSDESDHESLLIRKKESTKAKPVSKEHSYPKLNAIPLTILITDPAGCSHAFTDEDCMESEQNPNGDAFDDQSDVMDTNTLGPNSTFDISPAPEILIAPPTPPITLDKHTLDSIGEEEEEEETSQSTKVETIYHRISNEPLNRRWSDGILKREQEECPSPPSSSLAKIPDVVPVAKQTESPPVKLSRTRYLLKKLRLIPSKDDVDSLDSDTRKRTVRRSTDKKRYRTQ